MFVWTLVWLVTVAKVHSHWEPCKVQCDDNFKTNDVMQQASLMNVCKRGCDLFTVAFISTSNPFNPLFDRLDHPKALPLLIKKIAVVVNNEEIIVENDKAVVKNEKAIVKNEKAIVKNEKAIVNNEKAEMKNEKAIVKNEKMTVITVKGSTEGVIQLPSITIVDTKIKSSNSATDSSSKTTMEPTSQPVQDHPAEASKETTTTKGPKKLPYKVSQKTINVEENQKDKKKEELSQSSKKESIMKGRLEQAKHSCRHACVAAYGGAVEQEACVVGCHLQSTTASLNSHEGLTNEEPPKSPIGIFQNVIFKLASNVGRLVRVSWSWGSSSSQKQEGPQENKIQAYGINELPAHVQMPLFIGLRQSYNYPHPPKKPETIGLAPNQAMNIMNSGFFHLPRPIPNEITMNRHQNLPHIITIIKEETKQTSINGNQIFTKEEKFKETEDTVITDKKEQEPKEGQEKDQQQHQLDLLECISRKSGLPRWIIAIAIFASALVVLWLCFSLTAPPDDIKIVKTKPPEGDGLLDYDDEDYDDDVLTCSEKKKLLTRSDDVIKIRIENV